MTQNVKTTDLRREIIKADPDFVKDSIVTEEYQFGGTGDAAKRVFKANYTKRGPYAED